MKQSIRMMQVFADVMAIVCSVAVFIVGYAGFGRIALPGLSPVTGILLMFIGIVSFSVTTAKLMFLVRER